MFSFFAAASNYECDGSKIVTSGQHFFVRDCSAQGAVCCDDGSGAKCASSCGGSGSGGYSPEKPGLGKGLSLTVILGVILAVMLLLAGYSVATGSKK